MMTRVAACPQASGISPNVTNQGVVGVVLVLVTFGWELLRPSVSRATNTE